MEPTGYGYTVDIDFLSHSVQLPSQCCLQARSHEIMFYVFRLEVWPGFVTSILQFETSTMLIADVSHKILHGVTALDAMYEIYNRSRGGNFKEACAKKIIGQIVLTR